MACCLLNVYVDVTTEQFVSRMLLCFQDAVIHWQIAADREFRVQVAAYSVAGDGTKSAAMFLQTPPKLSNSPMVQLTMDKTTNIVSLHWWPQTPNIKQYKIEYGKSLRKFDMETNVKIKLVSADIHKSTFTDLDPGVYYAIKTYAEVDDGWTAADIKWIKTSDDVPTGPPLFFEGSTLSSSSIKLKWEEPDPWKRNGKIVGYVLSYKTSKDKVWLKEQYDLKGEEDVIIYIKAHLKADTRFVIFNLSL